MSTDPLSSTFSALSDPTRRAILARLALGETSVTELARPFDMSLPAVSRHLKVLESAGLIERGREAQWRPCRLKPEPLREAQQWIESYRRLWEDSLDRLDAYLQTLQRGGRVSADRETTAWGAPKMTASRRTETRNPTAPPRRRRAPKAKR